MPVAFQRTSDFKGDHLSVKIFGAVGDGVHDDTAAFLAALASTLAVLVPAGEYLITSTLHLEQGQTLHHYGVPNRFAGNSIADADISCKIKYIGADCAVSIGGDANNQSIAIKGIQFDGLGSTGDVDGIVIDGSNPNASAYLLFEHVSFTNFPRYQLHAISNVFDVTFRHATFMDRDRASGHDVMYFEYTPPPEIAGFKSQITLDDCTVANFTAGTWAVNMELTTDLRVFGGTIAPYAVNANGLYCGGGLYLYGTHIEGVGGTTNVGIRVVGTSGGFVSPGPVQGFAVGLQLGDPTNPTVGAVYYWIGGQIVGNTVDIQIVDGGSRQASVIGQISNGTIIEDLRASVDDVHEVTYPYRADFGRWNLKCGQIDAVGSINASNEVVAGQEVRGITARGKAGDSGATSFGTGRVCAEANDHAFFNCLTPLNKQSGLVVSTPDSSSIAGLYYDDISGNWYLAPKTGSNVITYGPLCPGNTAAKIYAGVGTPNGSVSAEVGSLYLNAAGGTGVSVYIKEAGSGNTGWVGVGGGPAPITDTHAHRLTAMVGLSGTPFYESDTGLTYVSDGSHWLYKSGVYQCAQAQLAAFSATLGAYDARLRANVSDFGHTLRWSGSNWDFDDPADMPGRIVPFLVDPSPTTGWHLCDGTASVPYLKSDGTTGTQNLPDLTSDAAHAAYLKMGSPPSVTVNAAGNPPASSGAVGGESGISDGDTGLPSTTLAAIPASNLLLHSEYLLDASWVARASATKDAANQISFAANPSSLVDQTTAATPAAGWYTLSVWARVASGTQTFRLAISEVGVTYVLTGDLVATTTPQLFTVQYRSTGGGALTPAILNGSDGLARTVIFEWLQLSAGLYPVPYAKTTSAAPPVNASGDDHTHNNHGASLSHTHSFTQPTISATGQPQNIVLTPWFRC